jgi:competence protein ComEA
MFKKPEYAILLLITILFITLMVGVLIGRQTGKTEIHFPENEDNQSAQSQTSQTETALPGKLNINIATVHELAMLPGIGDGYAQRIVEYRQDHGPFLSTKDLMNVKGIGEKRFEMISDYITVGG